MPTLKGLHPNETNHAMALYADARVSSSDQDFTLQEQALRAAGCDVARAGKASGTSRAGRTGLGTLLDSFRRGDTLVVTKIDRLARRGEAGRYGDCAAARRRPRPGIPCAVPQ
ncbi:recombinase family protein [Massilia violaceinigra]|uniref:recombinase family protein n=1 Tax=Massilia violaceinigra TaxID=2045208 RepID=UPI00351D206A